MSRTKRFQSTHPARGATGRGRAETNDFAISIHAPREGCDLAQRRRRKLHRNFNPRTPRGVRPVGQEVHPGDRYFNPRTPRGVRRCSMGIIDDPIKFQSTHPARGATGCALSGRPSDVFQSTHPARGATRKQGCAGEGVRISIHAPREGCDSAAVYDAQRIVISIHAPREGCDSKLYQRAESLLGSICLFAQGEEG